MLGGGKVKKQFDMVVLATGMEPAAKGANIPMNIAYEENGFVDGDKLDAGISVCGVARRPDDVSTSVQDATSAALSSLQVSARVAETAGGN